MKKRDRSVHIDIETFSESDLKKEGTYKYALHPSTDVNVICYCLGHDGPVHMWIPLEPHEFNPEAWPRREEKMDPGAQIYLQRAMPEDLKFWLYVDGREVRAWNAMFERVILNTLGATGRLDWEEVPLEQWYCTMAKASAHSLRNALGDCAKDCGTYPKDETGKMAMLQLAKPRKPSKKNPATRWTLDAVPDKYRTTYEYCVDDVRAEKDLDEYIPELSPRERKAYHLDQKINDRGIAVDLDGVLGAQYMVECYKHELAAKCEEITGVRPTQTGKLADWVRDECFYELENMQAATIIEALKDHEIPEIVAKVLKIYSTSNMKAVSKYVSMEKATGVDGRLRGMFHYHAASTGRWSSRIVQLQNLYRPKLSPEEVTVAVEIMALRDWEYFAGFFDKNPMIVLASCVRGMLRAEENRHLLCLDYSAIEARVIAWLAGQDDVLDVFKEGQDVYKHAAAKIYHIQYDEVNADQRFIGKIAVLALGYQGGKVAFAGMAKQYGVELEEEFAEKIKNDWRASNTKIVRLWYDLEAAAKAAVGEPGSVFKAANNRIMFKVVDDWLYMRLPSGRRLAYFKPELAPDGSVTFMGIDTYTRRWKRCDTYGGKLTENAVQAIARDLLLNGMFNLDREEFDLIGTVHDEVLIEDDDGPEEQDRFEQATELLCRLPDWAEGLPVEADGFTAKRYRK